MALPPELDDLSDDELRRRITRLSGTLAETDPAFHPAVHAELDLLRTELVDRLRRRHEGGEPVLGG